MLAGCIPWPGDLARIYREKGYWQEITLAEVLDRAAARGPDRVALVHGATRVTFGEVKARADRLAAHFVALGLKPRDRVIFQLDNRPELVYAFFALMRVGIIPVMALPPHRKYEIGHFLRHSGAVGYLIPQEVRRFDYRPLAAELAAEIPELRHVLVCGTALAGQTSLTALLEDEPPAWATAALPTHRPPPDEVALMLLSGGTTGLPKLIPRTHNDFLCGASAAAAAAAFDADTVFCAVLPMAHNYTLAAPGVLGTFSRSGRVVIAPDTEAETIFALIERERVTAISAAVPLVAKWMASAVPERHDLTSLRLFMNGGAKLAPEMRRRIEWRIGCTFVESFGTGEGLLNQTRLDDPDEIRFDSSGRPVCPGDEIKIIDEDGNELPDGTVGELAARGPYTIRGYYNAPEINARAFTADGFYRMGDAVKKVGGYLYVEGRKKDLINRGGEKISSEEIENLILGNPKVESVCVVAMPDDVYGEKACAFVILAPGQTMTLPELTAFLLAQGIAKFKLPERLEVTDEFPISPAGKILRRELRSAIAAKIAAEKEAGNAGVQV